MLVFQQQLGYLLRMEIFEELRVVALENRVTSSVFEAAFFVRGESLVLRLEVVGWSFIERKTEPFSAAAA